MCLEVFTYLGVMQPFMYETKIHDIDDLQKCLKQTCLDVIEAAIDQWINNLRSCVHAGHFLANVNLRSRSLYAIARPSVVCLSSVCLSVTLVHPTQAVQIFGNISTPFGTFAIR